MRSKITNLPYRLNIQFFAEGEQQPETKEFSELLTELKNTSSGFADAIKKQQDEIKQYGTTTDKTANSVKELESKFTGLQDELKKLKRPGYGGQVEEYKTAGALFAESDQYKQMLENRDKKSAPVQVDFFGKKALTTAADSAGALIVPRRDGNVLATPDQEIWLRDLLNTQNIDTNAIEYVRETGFTNNAGPVAEGELKPQSDLTFSAEVATVKTIAHWIPVTRQAIADARQLRTYIDGRLRYGLKLEEERQILYGDGTGENLQGLMTDPDVQEAGAVAAGDNIIDHLRRSFTNIILAGYPTTGIVLHPRQWEEIELMKGDDGHYLWLNLGDGVTPRLFRVPVVETPSMNEGDYLMGAFGLGAQLWDREQTEVRVGEPNDYFLRNMQALLAEERIALTTFRPEAFIRGSVTGTGEGA